MPQVIPWYITPATNVIKVEKPCHLFKSIKDSTKIHLGNCPFGKLPLRKIPLGSCHLGKYLTSFKTVKISI